MTTAEAQHVFEGKIIRHCAPTLAGVKAANLFNCHRLGDESFSCQRHHSIIEACQAKVNTAGVVLSVLVQRTTGALVFVYRPQALQAVLEHQPTCDFLCNRGYDVSTPEDCIASLRERLIDFECSKDNASLCERCEFPHEVGLLLGYPFEDVMAFMANDGREHVCSGPWKAYSDEQNARDVFACYAHYTKLFNEMFSQGVPIEKLAQLPCSA